MMTPQQSKLRWLGIVRMLMTALALCCVAGPLHAAKEDAHVLMLYGLDPYLPPFLAMDKAVRESLVTVNDGRVIFFTESLDSQRFAIGPMEPELVALLAKKYAGLHIEVVVAVSRTALDFFVRHGEQIWPGARVVYVGFLGYEFTPSELPSGASAVLSILDVAGTIDIARRLQPDVQRRVIVSGASEIDRQAAQQARDALLKLDDRIPVEFLSGLPLAELETRVAAEPPGTSIIYLTQFRDRDGRPYEPFNVLRAVLGASHAPVYGAAEPYIGFGVVAGSVASYESRGRLVGEQVRRALAGGSPDPSTTVLAAPNGCVADARALQRWSLDAGRLPQDCDIRFAVVPIWRQYWWQIVLTLAILAGQTLLIVGLLVQNRRRRVAEAELRRQLSENAHMNRRVVMGELTSSIAHELNQPLGAIYNNAGAALMLIKADPPDLKEVAEILEDIKRDDKHASDVIARIRSMLRKTAIEVAEVDVNAAIADTLKLLAFNASDHGVSLHTELESGLPKVRADRVQLEQVLLNVALNAMEAVQDQAQDRRRVVLRSRSADAGQVEVSVTDSGRGIPTEMLPRIFEPFVTSKPNGMGMGLSICRTIVEAYGGHIRAENLPEGGAHVHFTLPVASG